MFDEEVARGIALLDEKRPNWRDCINLEKFDISLGCLCILGQIYGQFSDGLDEICEAQDSEGRRDFTRVYGFNIVCCDDEDANYEAYKELQSAWITALQGGEIG